MTIPRAEAWEHAPISSRLVLGIDPGDTCGASLLASDGTSIELIWSREIETNSRDVEAAIADAFAEARARRVKLTIALEEWGRGGPLGLDQWIGLGAALGAWKRAATLAAIEGGADAFSRSSGFVRVGMTSWRSALLPGVAAEVRKLKGKARTEAWKRASTRAVLDRFPRLDPRRFGANAAESALIGLFAMRDISAGEDAARTERATRRKGRRGKRASAPHEGAQTPGPRPRKRKAPIIRLPLD